MTRPQFDNPWLAARVGSFMEEAEHGRWRLRMFTRDAADVGRDRMREAAEHRNNPARLKMGLERVIPEGTFISLQRQMTDTERVSAAEEELGDYLLNIIAESRGITREEAIRNFVPDHKAYVPVMSDTPAEIEGHRHAIERAHGHVVITGLGLGVLVSALLAKPDVESITVVDIDPDVLHLTGRYYEADPRVTIVQCDALAFPRSVVSRGRQFDYAWHDIWTHISPRNLRDDRVAEHGISYATMFKAYEPLLGPGGEQWAWALEEARIMEEEGLRKRERELEKMRAMRDMTLEERVEFVVLDGARIKLGLPDITLDQMPQQMREVFDPPGLREHLREKLTDDRMDEIERGYLAELDAPDDPLGDPNAHLKERA